MNYDCERAMYEQQCPMTDQQRLDRMAGFARSLEHVLTKPVEPDRWDKVGSLLSQLDTYHRQMIVHVNGSEKQT